MIICITSTGNTLDATVSPIFGRCPYYIFYDLDKDTYEAVSNPSLMAGGGAGIQAAQFIVNKGAKAVISGNIGPNAASVLQSAHVDMFIGEPVSIREAVDKFKKEELHKTGATTQSGYGTTGGLNKQPSQVGPDIEKDLAEIKDTLKNLSEEAKKLAERVEKLEKK